MKRIFLDFLRNRSQRARQVPLLVRGARQTGKSHIIRQYGSLDFAHLAEVNLELSPHFKECFKSLNAATMCRDIEVLSNTKLVDGKSLLFIDEIQESSEAILSLRAFKEQRPGLDVVAAGSLLEFALDDEALRTFPVGRINFAWLHPMSFREFINAFGETQIAAILSSCSITNQNLSTQISAAIHQKLLDLIREYYVIGGMPEVVDVYHETKSYLEVKQVQSRLSLGYVADFIKYRARYDHRKLQTILSAVPRLVGKQFKFSQVDTEVRARDLKQPLMDLEKAGLVRLVRATSANGVPLASEEREGKFKVQFLDIGLMLNMLGLNLGALPIDDALFANEGSLAEQFVGQELLANESPDSPPQLYYWHREAKGAEAEVDFVLAVDGLVIPIEVKAGSTGSLRSLRMFMKEKNSKLAIRISQQPLSYHEGILSVPFYLCGEIPRLARELAI